MKEIRAIIEAYDSLDRAAVRAALATVVRVEGSSYRRTGARMLVTDDGVWIGGISGGCLEGDALKRARMAITKETPSLVTYDTTQDDAHQIGVGLGCNGVIDVLFTPLRYEDPANAVDILKACGASNRKLQVLITVTYVQETTLPLAVGDVMAYAGPGSLGKLGDRSLELSLESGINQQIAKNQSATLQLQTATGSTMEFFVELLFPEIHLVLMGSQYDIYPLAKLARETGWRASVVANPARISARTSGAVDAVYAPDHFDQIGFDSHTAIVLMSHDFNTDKANLPRALDTAAPYIGLLGPRVRAEKILQELQDEGRPVSLEEMQRLFAPGGLDIGALTPEEIALSLLSEIRAVFSNRKGGFLRLRSSSIHERS